MLGRPQGHRRHGNLEHLIALERVIPERVCAVPRLLQVAVGEGVLVHDQHAALLYLHQPGLERREIGADLHYLCRIELGGVLQISLVGLDGFSVALELQRAQAQVPQDFVGRRRRIGGAKLAVSLFVAGAVGILEQIHARLKVGARLVRDRDIGGPRWRGHDERNEKR